MSEFPPPPPAPIQRKRRGWVAGLIASLTVFTVLLAASITLVINREQVRDVVTVWNYEPSDTVAGYIDRSALSERGEFLFKASQPRVAGPTEFNDECASSEKGMGILGCYLPATRSILLFDVTDDRLDGVEEAVAAHEMLHAAWDRMTPAEHDALGPLLEAEATKRADDAAFTERMEFYAVAEPGERLNELHSIIGTESADISAQLEEHYSQFFADRQVIVALHIQSDSVLRDIEAKAEKLSKELEKLYDKIVADEKRYESMSKQLEADVDAFNARASRPGGFASQAQFDRERAALIARQDSIVDDYEKLEKRNDKYNKKVDQLEELDAEMASLNKELNIETPPDLLG